MYYAMSRVDDDSPYHIYGKGDDAAAAEEEAARNLREDSEEAPALRRNLIVLTREEAEERGYVPRGAPVIWHDERRRYRVEDHGRYRPLPGERLARGIFR